MTNRKQLIAAVLVVVGVVALYADVLIKLAAYWAANDDYSHGFFVVPIAGYLAWDRRGRFQNAAQRPNGLGLALVLGSLLVLTVGVFGSELFLTRVSLVGTLAGVVLFLYGWARLKVLLFPLAFLLLMVPLPAIVFNEVAIPLQFIASRAGESALTLLHIPVLREGNILVLASARLEVAVACSGIRSLVSLLMLAVTFGYFADSRTWVRTAIALSTVPVAIVSNGMRVASMGVIAYKFGPNAIEGLLHTTFGWVAFLVAFLLILAFQQLLVRVAPRVVFRPAIATA